MNTLKITLAAFSFSILSSCTLQDSFYTETGGVEYRRLPIIKPFEVTTTPTNPDIWHYDFIQPPPNVYVQSFAQEICVIDSIIILKCSYGCNFSTHPSEKSYTIINSSTYEERIYENYEDAKSQIEKYGCKDDLKFFNISKIFSQFRRDGVLPWRK